MIISCENMVEGIPYLHDIDGNRVRVLKSKKSKHISYFKEIELSDGVENIILTLDPSTTFIVNGTKISAANLVGGMEIRQWRVVDHRHQAGYGIKLQLNNSKSCEILVHGIPIYEKSLSWITKLRLRMFH